MPYEAHITVNAPTSYSEKRWLDLCGELGIKPLKIELATGEHPIQVMCAAPWEGTERHARAHTRGLVHSVEAEGFGVVRVKLEMPFDEAIEVPPTEIAYHECHIKILSPRDDSVDLVATVKRQTSGRGIHYSRNLLASPEGYVKHYLTHRYYGEDQRIAGLRFEETFVAVARRIDIARMEMETVIYDTNPALDAGWADPPGGAA